jgi:hypothetical protein
MHEFKRIEEPPPISRSVAPPPLSLAERFVRWRTRAPVKRPDPSLADRFVRQRTRAPVERPDPSLADRFVSQRTRASLKQPGPGLADRFAEWRARRASATRPDPGPGHGWSGPTGRAVVVGVFAVALIGMQGWTLHRLARVRTELTVAGTRLEEARASLGMLWDMTKRLDEDQIAHLAQLTDSIRSVFAYAQGEIRLWEAAYYAQEQRLDDNAGMIGRNGDAIGRLTAADRTVDTRLGQLARVDQSQQGRLDGLESQARTQSTAVAALARRAETQEASVRGVASSVADLRATLATLDSELDGVEDELAESGTAYAQMGTRVDRVSGWMDGFRRAGLSAEAVDNRLSALTDELRRVRIRVDSLRRSGAAAGASERLR